VSNAKSKKSVAASKKSKKRNPFSRRVTQKSIKSGKSRSRLGSEYDFVGSPSQTINNESKKGDVSGFISDFGDVEEDNREVSPTRSSKLSHKDLRTAPSKKGLSKYPPSSVKQLKSAKKPVKSK
jgi:hypothetical protein